MSVPHRYEPGGICAGVLQWISSKFETSTTFFEDILQ